MGLGFDFAKFIWQLANFAILIIGIIIPIWIIVKLTSIDKSLKELLRKLDK